jgi:hypothetical protein
MFNSSFHRSLAQDIPAPPTGILNTKARSKIKTSTMPLQSKYKSSGHFAPNCSNQLFEIT